MTTPRLRFTAMLTPALIATFSAASAQSGMPADCPMHAEHQAEKAAAADHAGHGSAAAENSVASPYAALAPRSIAALSDEEIAALRAGSGHGSALPAELNHYPGPRHLIDHADGLGLETSVVASLQASFDRMHARAVALGEQLIAAETELDRLFADGRATVAEVSRLTAHSARLRGELRAVHLVAHVEAKVLLTEEQVARYDRLRSYVSPAGGGTPAGR